MSLQSLRFLRPGRPSRLVTFLTAGVAVLAVTGCTGNSSDDDSSDDAKGGATTAAAAGSNDETGDTVTIGFSAPAADHGWMGSITASAKAEADKYDDVDLKVAEGTNDVNLQISQVETFKIGRAHV